MADIQIILTPIAPVPLTLNPVSPVRIDMIPAYVYGPFTPIINVVQSEPDSLIEGQFYILLNE